MPKNRLFARSINFVFILIILGIIFNPFVIVNAGERGVLMVFGQVQERILNEGIHGIIPVVNTVRKLSVRIQKQQISAEASSKDLQEVFADVALNWHILPMEVNRIFQQIGDETTVIDRVIDPAVEEILKAVMAKYTAEELITKREEVKGEVDRRLTERLQHYHIGVDDISLVHVNFSERFTDAVEAKQIAEQEAKKAGFAVLKAIKESEAKINLARGEAEAYRILQDSLTPEILRNKTIDRWNGNLPLVTGENTLETIDLTRSLFERGVKTAKR
ncbi:prohibitin family protein [Pannus brasiliensis CCIBt3594]|uniref:Prohibitin family protein n=1 Tax=Pannus brasiliensis CCIBt3594 TaxID=1427578 RepID=A0AAW9QUH9_9CHRO